MAETRLEALIHQYDGSFQHRQKLADAQFAEELLSIFKVLPTRIQYQQADAKPKQCKQLKEYCLEYVRSEVNKSCMQFENGVNQYQVVVVNTNHVKELLDFASFLKTRSKSNVNVVAVLKSEIDNLKSELETVKAHNLTLNSNLKLAVESMNEEKSKRERIESELSNLLSKYQQQIGQIEEINENTTRASCDELNSSIIESESDLILRIDVSSSEDSLDTDNFLDECVHDELLISPPSDFQDDSTLISSTTLAQLYSQDDISDDPLLSRNFNLENLPKQKTTPGLSSLTSIPISSSFTSTQLCSRSEILETEVDQRLYSVQKSRDANLPKNHSKAAVLRIEIPDVMKITVPNSSAPNRLKDPMKTDENLPSSTISSLRCNICNKHCCSEHNLNLHTRALHNGEKPYKCSECGKRFNQNSSLKRHILVHGSKKPFKCSVCNKGFKDPSSKRRHERIVHEGIGNFQCAHCDKRFNKKENLISHIHTRHFSSFQKQFKCTICDKSFALKSQLKQHKFGHSSQRSFKCSVCDRFFKYPNEKIRHEKIIHGKGVRFRCQHCDKAYKLKAYLTRHLHKDHVELLK